MNLFNRTKKIIALSLFITLVPSQAQAFWGMDSLWSSIKDHTTPLISTLGAAFSPLTSSLGSLCSSISATIKENPAATCLTAGVALYFGYRYWQKSSHKKKMERKASSRDLNSDSAKDSDAQKPSAARVEQRSTTAAESAAPEPAIPSAPLANPQVLILTPPVSDRTQQAYNSAPADAVPVTVYGEPSLGMKMHSMSMPPLRSTPGRAAQAEARKAQALSAADAKTHGEGKKIETIMIMPASALGATAAAAPTKQSINEIVDTLEKEVVQLIANKTVIEPSEFEKKRALLEAQVYNLWLRGNDIQKMFHDRFVETLHTKLAQISPTTDLYKIVGFNQQTPLTTIQAKINAIDVCPIKSLLIAIFSCEYAKENYDAFLAGPNAIAHLAITDSQITEKLRSLFKLVKAAKQLPAAKRSLNVNQIPVRWRTQPTMQQPSAAVNVSAAVHSAQSTTHASKGSLPTVQEHSANTAVDADGDQLD